MRMNSVILLAGAVLLSACSGYKYQQSNRVYTKQAKELLKPLRSLPGSYVVQGVSIQEEPVGTVNFDLRKPNYVVIHHTAQGSCTETLDFFTKKATKVSSHYLICKDGTVSQLLNDYFRSWHAGVSYWGGLTDLNSASIGIEIDNNGFEPFTVLQINSLLELLKNLKQKYNIPTANFIGHSDIAPGRKVDPNRWFPWKDLAMNGFGHWYSDTTGITVPEGFDSNMALRAIGYDMKNPGAVYDTFKRKYLQDSSNNKQLDSAAIKVLYQLYTNPF